MVGVKEEESFLSQEMRNLKIAMGGLVYNEVAAMIRTEWIWQIAGFAVKVVKSLVTEFAI